MSGTVGEGRFWWWYVRRVRPWIVSRRLRVISYLRRTRLKSTFRFLRYALASALR
jgi:hypothetical protein